MGDLYGETVTGNVIIRPSGGKPIVGTHILQDFRLVMDLVRHTISRSRAMKAKSSFHEGSALR